MNRTLDEGDFGYAVTDSFDVRPDYGLIEEARQCCPEAGPGEKICLSLEDLLFIIF